MSALSFLAKKSWHTGLQSNQEAVWKAEKAALEERKKLDELRKERERERELQELERLNEESGGRNGKRQEKVDWMYQVPASIASSSQTQSASKEELEEYLLGKKRVDKLLTKGDESEKVSKDGNAPAQASSSASQAGSSAPTFGDVGSDRDIASKIREDPMFAIRQQEQAAYQALLKDPARLRAMRKAAGMDVGKSESKEERRRRKEEKRRRRDEEDRPRSERISESRHRSDKDDKYSRNGYDDDRKRRSSGREDRYNDDRSSRHSRDDRKSHYDYRTEDHSRSRHSHRHDDGRRSERYDRDRSPRRSVSPQGSQRRDRRESSLRSSPRRSYRNESSSIRGPGQSEISSKDNNAEREAKLAAMQKNAVDLSSSRDAYLAKVKEQEQADLAREEALRAKVQSSRSNRSHGSGFGTEAKGSFLLEQERSLYGSGASRSGENMDLAERLRRGRDTLQRFGDE